MKSSFFSALLASAAFAVVSAARADSPAASAGDQDPTMAPSESPAPNHKTRQAELLKKYDKNGDGKIDEDERAAAKADMFKNGTGGPRGSALRERIMKRFDKNGDGVLDENELATAVDALKTNPRFIQRFDKNGDGKLDETELASARQEITQRAVKARGAKKQNL